MTPSRIRERLAIVAVHSSVARDAHLGMSGTAGGGAQHGRGHGSADREQHGEQNQKPDAQQLHEPMRVRESVDTR